MRSVRHVVAGLLSILPAVWLGGCGQVSQSVDASVLKVAHFNLSGKLHGGQQPISGASIQIYSVNFGLDGIAATPILGTPGTSDANGNFNLTGTYTCPASNPLTYLVATGGNPGLGTSATNPNLALMGFTSLCRYLPDQVLDVDEITTVATVVTYGQFFSTFPNIGINWTNNAASYNTWAQNYLAIVDPATGVSPGPKYDGHQAFPFGKLYMLANVIASCVNSGGGVAGDSSPCGRLFQLSTPPGGLAPTNTVDALLNIWRNPTLNVAQITSLSTPAAPFQPQDAAPKDFYVRLNTSATPKFFQCTTYGDSLTQGNEDGSGVTIARELANLPSCYTANNQGVGGNNATEIAIREGGLASTATVEGGVIPAFGAVDVAFPAQYGPVTGSGPGIVNATLNGVYGRFSFNYSNGLGTFLRTAAGLAVNSPPNAGYKVDPGTQNQGFVLIWAGRNNMGDTQQTLDSIAAMVALLPSPKRFLVLSVTNTVAPWEQSGQPGYTTLTQTNQALQSAYPEQYLDIRGAVIAAYDPTNAEDVIDRGHDVPPSTMRAIDVSGNLTAPVGQAGCSLAGGLNTFPAVYTINIEQEKILIIASDGNQITQCTRGYAGTSAVAHAAGTYYTGTDAEHLNAKADRLIAQLVDRWIQANY